MAGGSRTYKEAGVDIGAADKAKSEIKRFIRRTFNKNVLSDVGLFGGLYRFEKDKYKDPVLVSSTDGVGTKLKIAFLTGRHDTVGRCLVNHCVNDILAQGAEPLFFLDYIASGRLDPGIVSQIVQGLTKACEENGCALIGGETAEMPDFYKEGEYDLAGFIVGAVERDRIIDGNRVREGDILIGLPSSGLHTNGYSLARKIIFKDLGLTTEDFIEELGRTISDELLQVHISYLKPARALVERDIIHGIAHITGGGFVGNVSRIMPKGLTAEIDTASWEPLPVFRFLQEKGSIESPEMYKVFNMGIGLVLIIKAGSLDEAGKFLAENKQDFRIIGKIKTGGDPVVLRGI